MATKLVNGVEVEMTPEELAAYEADQQALTAAVDNISWKISRQLNYPGFGEQLDMIWHAIDNGLPLDLTSEFYLARKAVKDAYPKPPEE